MKHGIRGTVEILHKQEHLYRLIISQLRYDGFDVAANTITKVVSTYNQHLPCAPSSKLSHLVKLGLEKETEIGLDPSVSSSPVDHSQSTNLSLYFDPSSWLDLEVTSDDQISSGPVSQHETSFITVHKGPATVAAFSFDGQIAASASADTSIKVLDVDRMLNKFPGASTSGINSQQDLHPVIRTLYDHTSTINTLDFHPRLAVLASGGQDMFVKMFDYSKPATKKAFKSIQEPWPIHCVRFHPGGDFLLVSTFHPIIRLYDIRTLECFVSSSANDHHAGPVNEVCWSNDAKMYASTSDDGTIKLWDGVSARCINTFKNAHGGAEVSSIQFSKNSKYLLSGGRDGAANLWELNTGRILNHYSGCTPSKRAISKAIFNHKEDYILMSDEKHHEICCWNSRNAVQLDSLRTGHNNIVRYLIHSPITSAFLTCSEDNRVRCWYQKEPFISATM